MDRHNAIRVGAVVEGQPEDDPVDAPEAGLPPDAACALSVWNT